MRPTVSNTSKSNGTKAHVSRRSWLPQEEKVLIDAMKGMIASGWKADNGFRVGYLTHFGDEMMKVFPCTDIRATPHINSKIHVWKKHFGMLFGLLGTSGIGWNKTTKMLDGFDEQWKNVLKDDPNAKILKFKPWPHYNDWLKFFGKDRATGGEAEDFGDAEHMMNIEENQTEIPNSPGLDGFNAYTPTMDEHETTSVGQSMCSQPTTNTNSNKKTNKGKRKMMDVVGPLVKALDKFTERTDARLGELTNMMAHEHNLSTKKEAVYETISGLEDLTLRQKLLVSNMIVKDHDVLELFFTLPMDAKEEQVRMMLDGNL